MFKTMGYKRRETVVMILLSLLKAPILPDLIQPSGPG